MALTEEQKNDLYIQALDLVRDKQRASTSMLQRMMKIGYTLASSFIQRMEEAKHIGPAKGNEPRAVFMKPLPGSPSIREQVEQEKQSEGGSTKKKASRKKAEGSSVDKKEGGSNNKKRGEGTKRKKGGRPNLYDELEIGRRLESIAGWCKQGITNSELAEMLGVSESVLYKWKAEKTEFRDAVRAGAIVADGKLIESAFNQAYGFHYSESRAFKLKQKKVLEVPDPTEPNGMRYVIVDHEAVEVVQETKYAAPNARMTEFLMRNRLPLHYNKQHEINVTGNNDLSHLTDEQLQDMISQFGDLEVKENVSDTTTPEETPAVTGEDGAGIIN